MYVITFVNRSGAIDSEVSLDVIASMFDVGGMSQHLFHLHLQRRDPSKNMARFYQLSLQHNLFGEISLIRVWGRIGTQGRQRSECYPNDRQAIVAFLRLARWKRLRGYRVWRVAVETSKDQGDRLIKYPI